MKRFVKWALFRPLPWRWIMKALPSWTFGEFHGHMQSAAVFPHTYFTRHVFWSDIATRLFKEPVLYLEFGVWRGTACAGSRTI
jgi:hypothetical protein